MKKNKEKILLMIFGLTLLIGVKVYAGYNGWLSNIESPISTNNEFNVQENTLDYFEENGVYLMPLKNSEPIILNGSEISTTYPELCFAATDSPTVLYEKVGTTNNPYTEGDLIDVRLSISNAVLPESPTSNDPSMICIKKDSIGIITREVLQVDWKVEYLISGSNTPIDISSFQKISNLIDGKYIGFNDMETWQYSVEPTIALNYAIDNGILYFTSDLDKQNNGLDLEKINTDYSVIKSNFSTEETGVLGTQSNDIKKIDMDLNIKIPSTLDYVNITKSVSDESKDNIVQQGEKITYTIIVKGGGLVPMRSTKIKNTIYNVPVRDSLLENIPGYYIFNNDVKLYDSSYGTEIEISNSTGSLVDGDFLISEFVYGSTYKIVFSYTASETIKLPAGDIVNKATDNGTDPSLCKKNNINCAIASIVAEPEPTIQKRVIDSNSDNIVQSNEILTYQIEIENETLEFLNTIDVTNQAILIDNGILYNVQVRDNLVEKAPSYLKFNNDVKVYDITDGKKIKINDYTGSLLDGTFVLNKIPNGSTYMLEFTYKASDTIGKDINKIINKATDNGSNPNDCTINTKDCAIATIDTKPDTGTNEDLITPKDENKTTTNVNTTNEIPNRTILLPRTGMNINNIFYILIISSTLLIVRKKVTN